MRGQNQLRRHKIDVAIIDQDAKIHKLEGVILKEVEETKIDLIHCKGGDVVMGLKVAAVIPNFTAFGFMKVQYDQKTLDWLEDNLHRIDNALTRALVWRNVWLAVKELKVEASQYQRLFVKNFANEPVF